jgi:hypothetical protein
VTRHALQVAACIGALAAQGAVAATAGFDGTYRGASTITSGSEPTCGKTTHQVAFTVVNGQFNVVWDPQHHVGINLVLQPDGSFSGSQLYEVGKKQGLLKASGRITGNTMDASIDGQYCARSYRLTKG